MISLINLTSWLSYYYYLIINLNQIAVILKEEEHSFLLKTIKGSFKWLAILQEISKQTKFFKWLFLIKF